MPENSTQFLCDDPLWQLGFEFKFDLLRDRARQQEGSHIHLNIAPTGNVVEKGMTLAWLLAFKKQWSLLEELSDKEGVESPDLNAAPKSESMYKGVTLALYLAANKKFDLLNKLVHKEGAQPVDLNAFSSSGSHPDQGITLALYFSLHKEWESLEKLADKEGIASINLNLMIKADKHPSKGLNLALHLAKNKKFKLLEKLAHQKKAELIDLNAKMSNDNRNLKDFLLLEKEFLLFLQFMHMTIKRNPISAISLLKEWSPALIQEYPKIVTSLLKNCEIEFLQELTNNLPVGKMLWETQLILSEKIFESMQKALLTYNELSEEVKEDAHLSLSVILNVLNQINDLSCAAHLAYYKKAQDKLAHILMAIMSNENIILHQYIIQQLNEYALLPHIFQPMPEKSMLKQAILICLSKAQNFELLANFIAEIESKKIVLEQENNRLKRELSEIQSVTSSPSKKHKGLNGAFFLPACESNKKDPLMMASELATNISSEKKNIYASNS